ncbi:hypothetical protein [Capnocytophaga sp.]|uniref:hypothetical protein n=1 Tax=Capnocytophaga sp. TaxID=44737 RepID=UPI0026DB7963|nr:hypothetical protein [Capnocytophaga sp.]MDO5106380.1 hypothetical protein [Capnocytophaga sp.]
MMKRIILGVFSLLVLASCRNDKSNTQQHKQHNVKSIDFEEFNLITISDKAQADIQGWKAFQGLMQVVVNMAPTKVKNAETLLTTNPDSLLTYTRLYTNSPKITADNASTERDWRSVENVNDTVFRIEKKKKEDPAHLQWNEYLVENIPYTFSFFTKKTADNAFNVSFTSGDNTLYESTGTPQPDTLTYDQWYEVKHTYTPKKTDIHGIRIGFTAENNNDQALLFYRPTLQIPAKDFHKVGSHSDKIIKQQTEVKSSYYAVFFWLRQIEDELKQLLADNDAFPETIKTPAIQARLHWLDTQVRELADNVKNNPDFSEAQVKHHIGRLQQSFNELIAHINKIYDSDLDKRMKHISTQADSTAVLPVKTTLETQPIDETSFP